MTVRKAVRHLFPRRIKVNVSVIYRVGEDIDETLKKIEQIADRHPDMDFKISVQW